jgi:hypothetical protein
LDRARVLRENSQAKAIASNLVVAERKVPEHLEERMVARCGHVLGRCAAARLHFWQSSRARSHAAREEHGLELDHARVGEEQGRIVAGHERRQRTGVVVALVLQNFREARRVVKD